MAKKQTLGVNLGRCEGIHGHLTCNGKAAGVLVLFDSENNLVLKTPHGMCQAEVDLVRMGKKTIEKLYHEASTKLGKFPAEMRRATFREGDGVYSFGNPEFA